MVSKVFLYIPRFIANPAKASEEIADDDCSLWIGFWWLITFCLAYSVTAFIYYLLGHQPVARPFLPIPLDKWYLVQSFTTMPVGLAGTLSYSGLAYIFCRAADGKGSFDSTFASQAYTLHSPTIILMWIPETLLLPFFIAAGWHAVPWPEWVEIARVFVVPFAWIFATSVVALSRIHGIPRWKSLIFVLISLIPTALIMAVFIR